MFDLVECVGSYESHLHVVLPVSTQLLSPLGKPRALTTPEKNLN